MPRAAVAVLAQEGEQVTPVAAGHLDVADEQVQSWQVGGRNKIKDFDEWAKLDLKYIDEWSLALDFKILLKTFPVVLAGTGAK